MKNQERGLIRFVVLVVIIVVLLFVFKVDLKTPLNNAWNKIKEFSTGESFDGVGQGLKDRKALIEDELE